MEYLAIVVGICVVAVAEAVAGEARPDAGAAGAALRNQQVGSVGQLEQRALNLSSEELCFVPFRLPISFCSQRLANLTS